MTTLLFGLFGILLGSYLGGIVLLIWVAYTERDQEHLRDDALWWSRFPLMVLGIVAWPTWVFTRDLENGWLNRLARRMK